MDPLRLPKDSERRYATVLFADISGFTSMSEKLDPEAVADIMNQCFSFLEATVTSRGGHVDKYIGDCIMALFGVPAALENAPQQAINAAIEMRSRLQRLVEERRVPVPLDIHIGINTGLVIAGNIGGEVKQDFTVMGDAVNLASRLKDIAPHKAIYVGAETHRYSREEFEFRKLEPLAVKGKQRPVEAYELLSVKERTHRPKRAGAGRMISSPLVGRDAELQILKACIAAVRRGEGGIVNLIGEAGLGKSRLLAEACASEEAKEVTVLEGRALSMGRNLRFHPFIDLLRHWAEIPEDEGEPAVAARLEAAVMGLLRDEAAEIFPFVAALMGVRLTGRHAERVAGMQGEAMETLLVKSMHDLFRAMAALRPLILIFEDLHWADRSSIQLLESLLRLVPDSPILFVHAFRPDYEETSQCMLHVSREQHGLHQIEITLEALDDRDCHALICNLLKTEHLPQSTLAHIARTTEGNPFYLEEVVRSLIDEGVVEHVRGRLNVTDRVQSVVIPDTIQGVVMARVDRLPNTTRHVLQLASVIGRSSHGRILAQLVPPGIDLPVELARLHERELLLERTTHRTASRRLLTFSSEVEYVFKHALVQETVYGAILQKTRKDLHLKVAHTIEATFGDRLSDFYGMLAYHFSRAADLAKAEEYLFLAGAEAARAAASSEALAFFREASQIYFALNGEGGDPRKKALLEKNIGLALLNTGQLLESVEHFDRALVHLGERVPRWTPTVAARFLLDLSSVLWSVYLGSRRRRSVRNLEHEREVCELYFYRGRAEITSDPRRLLLELPTGLRRLNRIDPRHIDQACGMYVSCAALFAYSGISFAISQRMLDMARTLVRDGSVQDAFIYREAQFVYHYLLGNWGDEHAIDDELLEQGLRYGEVLDVTNYLGLDCDRRLRRGDFAGARKRLEKLVEIDDSYGYSFAGTSHDGYSAILLVEERGLDKALRVTERYCAQLHEYAMRKFAFGLLAKAQLLRGDRAAAAACLVRAETRDSRSALISPWHQSTYLVGRFLFDVTALEDALARGDRSAARSFAQAARRSARRAVRVAAKMAKERPEISRLAGRLAWLTGRWERAIDWWTRAIAEAERMGARPELARTYAEVACRLMEPESRHRELGGVDAAGYLDRAEALFVEMGLGWDLEQLRAVRPSALGMVAEGARA